MLLHICVIGLRNSWIFIIKLLLWPLCLEGTASYS